jgi:hypothetical protein
MIANGSHQPSVRATRASWAELVVVYLMAVVGFGYFAGNFQDANTFSRLSLVKALVDERRFEIDSTQLDEAWGDFHTKDRSWYNGHFYSDKAIGSSLIGAALWGPIDGILHLSGVMVSKKSFKVLATFLGVSLVCAFLAPVLYAFVTGIAGSRTAALVAAAIVFGTPVFKYSTGFYGHVQAGLFFFLAFLIWFHAKRAGRLSPGPAAISCALLGVMVVTEYPTAVLALVLGIYMLTVMRELGRLTDWRIYAAGAVGFLIALAPLLYYNVQVYGQPLATGYQHHATAEFAEAHSKGLSGIGVPDAIVMFAMTFHPLMGIFWQSPVLLLAFVGWFAMRRSWLRVELAFSLAAIVIYIALISGYYEWSGGLSYTPRHLIPLYPLFAVPMAVLPRRWVIAGWPLTAISVVQHLLALTTQPDYVFRRIQATLDVNHHPAMAWVSTLWTMEWPNLQAGLWLKNRGSLFMPAGYATLLPLLLAEVGLGVLLVYAVVRRQRRIA